MDLSRICRSCMRKISLRTNRTKENDTKTAIMFCFCLNMKISDGDKLPKQFCGSCVSKIKHCYSFLKEAQKADLTLRNMLSRAETSVIVKPEPKKTDAANIPIKTEPNMPEELQENVLKVTNEYETNFEPTDHKYTCNNINNSTDNNFIKLEVEFDNDYDDNHSTDNETNDQKFCIRSSTSDKKPDKKYNECPICLKRFGSKLWFSKHIAKEHGQKKYSCKYCPKTFNIQSKWKHHLTIHSVERNFSCAKCGKLYKRRKQLAAHMQTHQEVSASFICDLCSKSFKKKHLLAGHLMLHRNDRNHLCNVCGLSFLGKGNLATHIRIHTGEKPYKCGVCDKAFNTSSSRSRHERLHRDERPYACEACDKAFKMPNSLIRHRRTHTGELPYKCPWCTRCFLDSWKRKVHLMRTHNVNFEEIPRLTKDGTRVGPGRPSMISRNVKLEHAAPIQFTPDSILSDRSTIHRDVDEIREIPTVP